MKTTRTTLQSALLVFALGLGACSDNTDLFPLVPGQVFSYRQTVTILKEPKTQKFVVSSVGPTKFMEVDLFEQRAQRTDKRFYRQKEDGLYRFRAATKNDRPEKGPVIEELLLPTPINTEINWTLDSRLRLVESRTFAREDKLFALRIPVKLKYQVHETDASVSVPAGKFDHCVHVVATGMTTVPVDRHNSSAEVEVEHHDWYAPGVGLVRSQRFERSESTFLHSGEYLLELESVLD